MKKSLKTVLSASMAALCVFGFGMSANAYELNPEVKDVTPALREASTVGVWTAENPAMKNAPNKDAVLVMTSHPESSSECTGIRSIHFPYHYRPCQSQ